MAHMSAGTTDTTACCLVGFAAAEPNSCQSPILSKAWTLDALYACQTPPRYTPLAMSLLLLQQQHFWVDSCQMNRVGACTVMQQLLRP